jgi:hypothetical protein
MYKKERVQNLCSEEVQTSVQELLHNHVTRRKHQFDLASGRRQLQRAVRRAA